jgi:hypothetical protein
MNFLQNQMLKMGVDYIKNNPETVDNFCGKILNFCCEKYGKDTIVIFLRNKHDQPQISIASVNKTDNRIVQIHESYTSDNLFELLNLKKDE